MTQQAVATSPAFRTILPRVRRPRHPVVRFYRRNERSVLSAAGVVVFFGGFFSIILPTVEGVRTVERSLLDVARSFGARERLIFTSLVIPGTLPFIASGMRVAVGRVLAGVIIAEFYAQTSGIGVMVARSAATQQPDRMLFGVLIFTLLGIALTEGIGIAERYFQRWRPSIDLEEAA